MTLAERTGLPVHATGIGKSLEDQGLLEPREHSEANAGASSQVSCTLEGYQRWLRTSRDGDWPVSAGWNALPWQLAGD